MIDAACNYLNPYASVLPSQQQLQQHQQPQNQQQQQQQEKQQSPHPLPHSHSHSHQQPHSDHDFISATTSSCSPVSSNASSPLAPYTGNKLVPTAATAVAAPPASCTALKMEMQYPPQSSSTGTASPNSSIQSAPSSASVSPSIFPSPTPTLSFSSISASPSAVTHALSTSASGNSSSAAVAAAAADLGAAAVASAAYSWNTAAYTAALPTRNQFPYAQYASDYYGNAVGMPASGWFSHQDRLYQPWSAQSYPSFNFDDIAFQTQLQRRSVRCTCPNCTNEMSGLPPIVGPDERGRKQHICHIPGCERLYGKASHLKTHLRWHTGERPFLCLTCGKRFSRSDELQRHGRTHTNYRPYACPICSKKFSRSDHLSKHKKTHFKDKKSKKALAVEVKEEAAFIKQEKAAEKVIKKPAKTSVVANPATNTTNPAQVQFKTEQPDASASYVSYTNFYQQSGALFQSQHQVAGSYAPQSTIELWNSQRSAIEQHQQPTTTTTSNSNHQTTSASNGSKNSSTISAPISAAAAAAHHHHHYAALAMQSESQLAAEYGLTMSGLASGASDSSSSCGSNSQQAGGNNNGYSGLIGHMKSEYANYADFTANSTYGPTSTVAALHHHHHTQNPWAAATAYQHPHPHATA